jgi:hypothetical protein
MTVVNRLRATLWIGCSELAASLLSAFCSLAPIAAGEPDSAEIRQKAASSKLEKTVEGLASLNRPPSLSGLAPNTKASFDASYDWSDQDRVKRALDYVCDHADGAWTCLFKHVDDRRYCITWQFKEDARNVTISDVCQDLICGALIAGYYDCLPDMSQHVKAGWSPRAPGDMSNDELLSWCRERKDKKLCELQLEMCHWAIAKIKQSNRSREFPAIEAIEKNIAFLQKYQKSLRPIRLAHRSKHVTFFH